MADRSENAREASRERLQQVFDVLRTQRRGAEEQRRENFPGWLERRIVALPDRARDNVRGYERELKDAGVSDEGKMAALVEGRIAALEQTYQDHRFALENGEFMLKKEYVKEQLYAWFRKLTEEDHSVEALKRVALVSMDANGLKAINDLSGSHENGTAYLQRIAEVLHDRNGRAARRFRELGIEEAIDATAGGDEYVVALRSAMPLAPDTLGEISRLLEDEVRSRTKVDDLVDFQERGTRLRYLRVSEETFEALPPERQRQEMAKLEKDMPPGFAMRASVSGGAATLYDGMLKALQHPSKPLTEDDAYDRAVSKILGGLWDAADAGMMESKASYKEALRGESAGPEDRFYAMTLARTTEASVLEERLVAMQSELRRQREMEKDMAALEAWAEETGADDAAYASAMRAIRAKYRSPS